MLLGQRQELVGPEHAALGMAPAHQRLDAGHAARAQLDLGLEVQDELVVVDGVGQLAGELDALAAVAVLARRVDLDLGLARLGLVHRDVGVAQQQRAVGPVQRGDRGADAGADLRAKAVEVERLLEHVGEPPRGRARGVLARAGGQQHDELVAAEAAEQGRVGHRAGQPRS